MTYNEAVKKPISKKIILVELDQGVDISGEYWSSFEPGGLWVLTYSNFARTTEYSYGFGAYGYFPYGSGGIGTLPEGYTGRPPVINVGSLLVEGENLTPVSSIANLRSTNNSFYWDFDNQLIYIHIDENPNYDINSIVVGATTGYSTEEGFLGGIFFRGRVKSVPSINFKKDPLYFGKISFDEGTIVFDNIDGFFDDFDERDLYGQRIRLKFGFDAIDFTDFATVYTGFFESSNTTAENYTIKIRDPRKNISVSIPENTFDTTTYPNLEDDNIGEVIPLGYGLINKQPAVCTNETATASTYNFKFVDTSIHTIQSIDAVYVEGVEVAFLNGSTTNGTFDLSSSVYEPGQDVSVSYEGYDITNPLDILEDLFANFTDIAYTSDQFDITEWEATKALVPDVALAVIESKSIVDIIGDIATSVQGVFMFKPDGKITFRLRDTSKDSVDTIEVADQLSKTGRVQKPEEYTSSIRVGYRRAWSTNKHSYFTNSSREAELFARYRRKKSREIKTLLTNASDAQTFSENLYDEFGGVFDTLTFDTTTRFINLLLEDNIDAYRYFGANRIELYKLEVIGISINLLKAEMKITGRFIAKLDLPDDFIMSYSDDSEYIITYSDDPDYIIGA